VEARVRITPLEIRSHRFARSFKGADPDEVEAFLELIAEDFESLARENEELHQRTLQLEDQVKELSSQEALLQETLISAQAMSQDLRQTAVKEAEVLLAEAELRAEKIIDAGHRRSAKMSEEIRGMRQLRSGLASSLRATIETHLKIVDSLELDSEPEQVDAPASVTYRARSSAEPGQGLPELVPEED
jgi:cell division initiation protein